jgi:hypothetical protein
MSLDFNRGKHRALPRPIVDVVRNGEVGVFFTYFRKLRWSSALSTLDASGIHPNHTLDVITGRLSNKTAIGNNAVQSGTITERLDGCVLTLTYTVTGKTITVGPGIPSLTLVASNGKVTGTITPGTAGTSPIVEYLIYNGDILVLTTPDLTFELPVPNGFPVTIGVRARTLVGLSDMTTDTTTPQAPIVEPEAPGLNSTVLDSAANITFVPGDPGSSPVTSYTLWVNGTMVSSGLTLTRALNNLTNGVDYTIVGYAISDAGVSDPTTITVRPVGQFTLSSMIDAEWGSPYSMVLDIPTGFGSVVSSDLPSGITVTGSSNSVTISGSPL